MAQSINLISILLASSLFFTIGNSQSEARKIKSYTKCNQEECQLKPAHFTLYSFIKRSLESDFDINGKEIYSFLKSIEVLKRRFRSSDVILNGTESVNTLLNNETLHEALKVFESDEGKELSNLYKSSVNGKSLNLACSSFRVDEIERAASKLNSNKQLAKIFSKIHQNFVKKSSKKCLKHACNSVDQSLSQLDSIVGKKKINNEHRNKISTLEDIDKPNIKEENLVIDREFDFEERELCFFFKRTNETDCAVSGRELSEIDLTSKGKTGSNLTLSDYLSSYYVNHLSKVEKSANSLSSSELNEAKSIIDSQCKVIGGLLDYNLAAIKWYQKQGFLNEQKINTRTFWCPSLHYWLQVDRLCSELKETEVDKNEETFPYEITSDKKPSL